MSDSSDIFKIPVLDKYLIYGPLHNITALVDGLAIQHIQEGLQSNLSTPNEALQSIVDRLRSPRIPVPKVRTGELDDPLFLGIIPTRDCNMACRYCDFTGPTKNNPAMDLKLARDAVDAYIKLLSDSCKQRAEVHFFGGEPFFAEEIVHFVVSYALKCATELDMAVHFEVTTNGLYNSSRCQWIADHFDTIVLSLDGPADIQELHRPAINGHSTYDVVIRNARIISESTAELIIRSCVTEETTARMPEIAEWICNEFRPSIVSFESLIPSHGSQAAGLSPPSPWEFAQYFDVASQILEANGIETILSTANISNHQASFCPVGKDALIISPNGKIDACYLLEEDWERMGLDMHLGQVSLAKEEPHQPVFEIDQKALQRMRSLNVYNQPLCSYCICRYHCAGGCHVNHDTSALPGLFDDLCIQTRLITIATLLKKIGQHNLVKEWVADLSAMENSIWQPTDRIFDSDVEL